MPFLCHSNLINSFHTLVSPLHRFRKICYVLIFIGKFWKIIKMKIDNYVPLEMLRNTYWRFCIERLAKECSTKKYESINRFLHHFIFFSFSFILYKSEIYLEFLVVTDNDRQNCRIIALEMCVIHVFVLFLVNM